MLEKDGVVCCSLLTFMKLVYIRFILNFSYVNFEQIFKLNFFYQVNPPFFAPAVELVPAPWTDSKIMNKAEKIMNEIGQVPIQLKKECDGFLINRIQYAIFQASWQLIKVQDFTLNT